MSKRDWSVLHTDVRPAQSAHTSAEVAGVRDSWRNLRGHPRAEVKTSLRTVRAFCADVQVSVLVVREKVAADGKSD